MVSCTKCRKAKAVFSDCQSGLCLCPACFSAQFEKRVWKANKDFSMLRRGDRIAVAISGGKDSAAMLHVLNKMAEKIGKIAPVPVLIDEGISGYRPKCLAEAGKLCKKEKLKLRVFTFKELFGATLDEMIKRRGRLPKAEAAGIGACSICGVFRKKALSLAAKAVKANKLAVGHNLDDLAQTFLMNLLRNEPGRIGRMGAGKTEESESQIQRIRPLIYNSERECAAYSLLEKLPHSSAECPYSSEAFRGEVRDFLNQLEETRPGTKKNLLLAWLSLTAGEKVPAGRKGGSTALEAGRKLAEKTCEKCGAPSSSGVCQACAFLEKLDL